MAQGGADVRAWVLAGLETEAVVLLDRMGSDPEARRRYAELAERQGWPCYGMSGAEWAADSGHEGG